MARTAHRIFVAKEAFKFSCAHMTVFPDGSKERLHGHNYMLEVALDLAGVSLDELVDFAPLKREIAALCAAWKERFLLAERCPQLEWIRDGGDELEFRLCGQRYVMPAQDALRLPIENTTVEQLAVAVTDRLVAGLPPGPIQGIEVTVLESPGQGASHYRELAR